MSGQTLPHDSKAEAEICRVLLADSRRRDEILDLVGSHHFADTRHRLISEAVRELVYRGIDPDPLAVADHLEDQGNLGIAGGRDYVLELARGQGNTLPAAGWAKRVRRVSDRRALAVVALELSELAFSGDGDPIEAAERAMKNLADLTVGASGARAHHIREVVGDVVRHMERVHAGEVSPHGLSSGSDALDRHIHGFEPGDLVVLGARPSMGKTAFALHLAQTLASNGAKVLVLSLEMRKDQLVMRILSSASGVLHDSVMDARTMGVPGFAKLAAAANHIIDLPIWIADDESLKLRDLRAFLRAHQRKHGLDIVMIDYLQIVHHQSDRGTRERDMAEVSTECKRISKSLGISTIVLSQLNRKLEERRDKRPILSDLRDTGQLEQDADKVLFLYRDEFYNPTSTQEENITELIVAKARNGRVGTVRFRHELDRMRYREAVHQ